MARYYRFVLDDSRKIGRKKAINTRYGQLVIIRTYLHYINNDLKRHLAELQFCTLDEAFEVIYRYQQQEEFYNAQK